MSKSDATVFVNLVDKFVSERARRAQSRTFKWTADFVKAALSVGKCRNIAVDVQPQEPVSLMSHEKAKCRIVGEVIKLKTRPKDGFSAWEYDIHIRSKPCDAATFVQVFDALSIACERENGPPKREMKAMPTIQEIPATATPAAEPAPSGQAFAALNDMMKAAARLDLANEEMAELRRSVAMLREDQAQIKKTLTEKEDRLAALELEIEADPNARLAKNFIETMAKMMGKS